MHLYEHPHLLLYDVPTPFSVLVSLGVLTANEMADRSRDLVQKMRCVVFKQTSVSHVRCSSRYALKESPVLL